ncbi:hypothetical protein [Streptomyces massasporeus]|uniref:hypothetical protein n=1 Tax=Streptomyces massasporeus TaxID=67324 RepID=UPI0033FECCB1
MNVTTTLDGTSARIGVRGEIDFDTLPPLRAAAAALPPQVPDPEWDLTGAPSWTSAVCTCCSVRPRAVRPAEDRGGLGPQPLWPLLTASETDPAVFDLSRLLPDIAPAGFRPAAL